MTKNYKRECERSTVESTGLDVVVRDDTNGEERFLDIFKTAAKAGKKLRFLRLGCPPGFRAEIIAGVAENGDATEAVKAVLNPEIPSIEFVLADPSANAFLTKLDAEHKKNPQIWRIRAEVLEFARGLLRIRDSRRKINDGLLLNIAIHRCGLLWNMCVTGEDHVILRAYHETATGHDGSISEIELKAGSKTRLAESFIFYYDFVLSHPATRFLSSEDDFQRFVGWPSLFKGNAVFYDQNNIAGCVKILSDEKGQEAECAWLNTATHVASTYNWFCPARLIDRDSDLSETYGGHGIQLAKADGISAERLLFEAQHLAVKYPLAKEKLQLLVSTITDQAFAALKEFRNIRETAGEKWERQEQPYPWPNKLVEALDEAGRYLTQDTTLLADARKELSELGRYLQDQATVPFRDAHLKNRLIALEPKWTHEDPRPLLEWLNTSTPLEIIEWLRTHTTDIDFETAAFLVTPWDDPLHIITSPNLGIDTSLPLVSSGARFLKRWGHIPRNHEEEHAFTATLLCRTFREICRRAWYANVMPNTYKYRYETEKAGYFLRIAKVALPGLNGYKAIGKLLKQCKDDIWPNQCDWDEPVRANVKTVLQFDKAHGKLKPPKKSKSPKNGSSISPVNTEPPRPDVLLVTVNDHETRAVLDGFNAASDDKANSGPCDKGFCHYLGSINGTTVFHARSEMGSSGPGAMQETVDEGIRLLKPGAVIAVGVAFGVDSKKQKIGDVLLAKQIWVYEPQRIGKKIVFRGDKAHATPRLIKYFEGFTPSLGSATAISGLLLTGEKLIDDINYRNNLLSSAEEAIGGDMESAGLYTSCLRHKVNWIVIKAICDWADGAKSKNKTNRQKKAARNAVQFFIQALQNTPLKNQ